MYNVNMKLPLISVIVPVYNDAKYLDGCLSSIISQTYKNLEIIVVNDGATDDSPKIIKKFAADDARIKVIEQQNQGLSAARNTGLKQATGRLVAFIDADDDVSVNYFEYLFKLMYRHRADLSICAIWETINGKNPLHYGRGKKEKVLNCEEALTAMLKEDGFNVSAYAKLYKKELFDGVEFPIGKIHEDLGTTYKTILRCNKIAYGPKPKYHYNKHSGSLSTSAFSKQKLDILELTDIMCADLAQLFPTNKTLQTAIKRRRVHARLSVAHSAANISAYLPSRRKQ